MPSNIPGITLVKFPFVVDQIGTYKGFGVGMHF